MEVRSTAAGFLGWLDKPEPPDGATLESGIISIVIREADVQPRPLPSVYFDKIQLAAHRDVERIVDVARRAVHLVSQAHSRATYLAQAFRFQHSHGLYIRDLFAGSIYRRKMARMGIEFSDDPFVRFNENGEFEASDWPPFRPDFVIMSDDDETNPQEVVPTTGALVPFTMADFRLGPLSPDELALLTRTLRSADALSAGDPQALVSVIADRE